MLKSRTGMKKKFCERVQYFILFTRIELFLSIFLKFTRLGILKYETMNNSHHTVNMY